MKAHGGRLGPYTEKYLSRIEPKIMLLMPKDVVEMTKAFVVLIQSKAVSFRVIENLTGIDLPSSIEELKESLKYYEEIGEIETMNEFDSPAGVAGEAGKGKSSSGGYPKTSNTNTKNQRDD